MEETKLYTVEEVAKELNLTGGYVRMMISRGVAKPAKRMGKILWVFDQAELDRLRSRRQKGRPAKE